MWRAGRRRLPLPHLRRQRKYVQEGILPPSSPRRSVDALLALRQCRAQSRNVPGEKDLSLDRISKDAGWVNPDRLPRGPGGRALCRECDTEVPPGRRTFCSSECVDAWKLKTDPGHCRRLVWLRDRGVCAVCRVDTGALEGLVLRGEGRRRHFAVDFRIRHKLRHRIGDWWDTDHIVPVTEGGGGCGLDGYRTLCVWCHRRETAALRARMATERRARKRAQAPLGVQRRPL